MAENGQKKLLGNSVNISVSGIPEELLHEFSEKVMKPQYAGGISEAVKDLMQEAVDKQKQNEVFQRLPWKKDEERFHEAADLIGLKRRYENYAIFASSIASNWILAVERTW